jgi:hypothetical protein
MTLTILYEGKLGLYEALLRTHRIETQQLTTVFSVVFSLHLCSLSVTMSACLSSCQKIGGM